ncbi:hypothetical protein [Streptomyces hydrogenans]|uniref:hypothetical protein n=1 Tax=Streptomyces hydrogenans TaxID=1873719 RepID=UPI0036E5EB34
MPLNVPVTLTLPPLDQPFTVHADRQRWSPERLAAEPDGRAALEAAVRAGVRSAAAACAYAGLTEPEITVTEHPDGSVAMTARVLCDEPECHAAAGGRAFDTTESAEARACADWAAEKQLGLAAGGAARHRDHTLARTLERARRRRAGRGLMLVGGVMAAAGWPMSEYDYQRPADLPGNGLSAYLGENLGQFCDTLGNPLLYAGIAVFFYGFVRAVTK